MLSRRGFLTRSGLGLLGTSGLVLGLPGDNPPEELGGEERIPDGSASKGMITARTEDAISRGLAFLQRNRDREGSFGTGGYRGNVAVTALSGMAFMCFGSQPGRGPYGRIIQDSVRFILGKENVLGRNPGFLHNPAASLHGPMYGHGFATLFLSEVYGMVHDRVLREELRAKLRLAINLILTAQRRNGEGAWRYEPGSSDADLSVTICQIMALRSARNAGIGIPKKAVDDCTAYVKACQERREGWFRYMKRGGGGGGVQGFARTAAGVCALNAAGIYKGPEVEEGLKFLARNKPVGRFGRPDLHYFYGHYYAVQAMWTAGGAYWNEWYPAIRDELLDRQSADGSWVDQICSHYGTAMACIILQVPNNYLPILQK
ncbi:MAG: prenyltransferase [Planctomycetia bacterium]|nr:prenyltransferase [Planctomycetia bacterium]